MGLGRGSSGCGTKDRVAIRSEAITMCDRIPNKSVMMLQRSHSVRWRAPWKRTIWREALLQDLRDENAKCCYQSRRPPYGYPTLDGDMVLLIIPSSSILRLVPFLNSFRLLLQLLIQNAVRLHTAPSRASNHSRLLALHLFHSHIMLISLFPIPNLCHCSATLPISSTFPSHPYTPPPLLQSQPCRHHH